MFILTEREIEFLTSLQTSWRRLYWRELTRILVEDVMHEVRREARGFTLSRQSLG